MISPRCLVIHVAFCLFTVSSGLSLVGLGYGQAQAANVSVKEAVGKTVAIEPDVKGSLDRTTRQVSLGEDVFRRELLETGPKGEAELRFHDDTKLALGPSARLTLDEFIVGEDKKSATTVAMTFLKGAFRFISGSSNSRAYKLQTVSATLGIRGTLIDIFVDETGEAVIYVHEGAIVVCSRTAPGSLSANCRQLSANGKILYAGCNGEVTLHDKYSERLLPGVNVAQAFPFVGSSTLLIDPVARASHPEISEQVAQGGIPTRTRTPCRPKQR
jgi:hypothetical protein